MDSSIGDKSGARRLAIMGGTFDPIHFGHLLIAEQAREFQNLDSVVFVPNGTPVFDKRHKVTSAEERYHLCSLAIAGNPWFSLSRVELDRPGPSFAIDTVNIFRSTYPNLEALFFITGADAVLDILGWYNYDQLIDQCEFIAATRPGFKLDNLNDLLEPSLLKRIHFLAIPGLDISSTEIRKRVSLGQSIRYLTPDAVVKRIEQIGLYE
jgi:nicotinate-nucleotide adenylyltransferase